LLEQRSGEPHRDRRAFPGRALNLEPASTDLRTLAHHRHAEVAFGPRSAAVEAHAVVAQGEHDVAAFFAYRDPHVSRLGVLQRVHHTLAGDVEHEQRDRRGQIDFLHVAVESHRRVAAHLIGERLERLGEPLRAER
jgi:hypothetical protein